MDLPTVDSIKVSFSAPIIQGGTLEKKEEEEVYRQIKDKFNLYY